MAKWPFGSTETVFQDLRYAYRILRRNPGFTATTIATLALGIGASTVIFSVVDAVLLKPLSYKNSDRIYRVHTINAQGRPIGEVGPAYIDPMPDSSQAIQAAAYGYSHETSVLNRRGTAFAINEYRVSGQFFKVFSDPLTLGRGFRPGDNYMKTVLSYQLWRDVFGSDSDIVGSVIRVNGSPLTVIGVAGKGFEFPVGTGIWTKIFTSPATKSLFNMEGYLRASPGVSGDQIQAQLDVLATRLGPTPDGRRLQFVARSLRADVVGDFSSTLVIISGATAILLLIACLNVANLLFTRGTVRGTEIAMREALGASTTRVFRQLMTETLLLCAVGGALGLALAVAAVRILRAVGPGNLPRFGSVSVDLNAFLFTAACVVLTALLVGFVPALRSSRSDLGSLINQGGRSGSAGPGRNRIFGALVVAEIALAVVLVIGAGLLVKSYSRLLSTDPGFQPDRMLTLLLNVPGRLDIHGLERGPGGKLIGYKGTGYLPVARLYENLIDRIRALPGVESAGATSGAPLRPGLFPISLDSYQVVGDSSPGASRPAYTNEVTPGFFTVLGLHAIAGRLLEPADRRDTRGVAVVNQTFARAYCGGVHCVGRHVRLPSPGEWAIGGLAFQLGERVVDEAQIVGVVPDVKQGSLSEPVRPAIYVPLEQWTLRRMAVLVRSKTDDPGKLIPAIRHQVEAMAPKIPPVFAVYSDVIASSLARQRLGMLVLVAFGLVSLTLAAIGIYGVVSYSASQRTSELAVRSAFGAEQRHLLELFVARGLRLSGIGIILGVAGAIALRQVVASQLYEVSTLDPEIFVLVPLSLLLVALLASYVPARRAARMNPFLALRED